MDENMSEVIKMLMANMRAAGFAVLVESAVKEWADSLSGVLTFFSHTETDGEAEVVLRVNFKEEKDEIQD